MDLGLTNRRAVIIGGSSGLGLAAASALAREGAHVTLFARNTQTLSTAARGLATEHEVPVDFVAGDLTRRDDVVHLRRKLESAGTDILILNTPRPPSPMRDFLDETEDERWEQAYRDQLHGALNVLREITPSVIKSEAGRVVGITSASVKQPMPRHAISSIFRAGVQTALKHLSQELASSGTTVNSVAPATIVTSTFAQFHNMESRIAATPLGRAGTPEELGAIVAFLASSQAGFITGQTIQLDGGRTTSLV